MRNRSLILGAVALVATGLFAIAQAQVNVVPQIGVSTGFVPPQTFSATWVGLVPAASATDVVCISGSATKTIRLRSIKFSGTATTAINLPMTLLRRASVDTGGTAASTTANPANTIGKRDTTNGAATATLIAYTANPTITDTSPTYVDSAYVNISTSATLGTGTSTLFDFGKDAANLLQMPTLRGTAQQLCVNLNATSIGAAGTTTGSITWTEE